METAKQELKDYKDKAARILQVNNLCVFMNGPVNFFYVVTKMQDVSVPDSTQSIYFQLELLCPLLCHMVQLQLHVLLYTILHHVSELLYCYFILLIPTSKQWPLFSRYVML